MPHGNAHIIVTRTRLGISWKHTGYRYQNRSGCPLETHRLPLQEQVWESPEYAQVTVTRAGMGVSWKRTGYLYQNMSECVLVTHRLPLPEHIRVSPGDAQVIVPRRAGRPAARLP